MSTPDLRALQQLLRQYDKAHGADMIGWCVRAVERHVAAQLAAREEHAMAPFGREP